MSTVQQSEHEAKFVVGEDDLPALSSPADHLEGYLVHTVGVLNQIDTYMDTPAYGFLRRGLSLRIRQKGEGYEVGIKGIQATFNGAVQERPDVAVPLAADSDPFDPTTWPSAVQELLGPYSVKADAIQPVVVIHQQRQKSHISQSASAIPVAEWSLDEVWFTSPASPDNNTLATNHNLNSHFHELEIELLSQTHQTKDESDEVDGYDHQKAFADLVNQVQERFHVAPIYTSKFVRALDSAIAQLHGSTGTLSAEMELEAAGRLFLHQQLLQIILNENGVRTSTETEYVHAMRVAIRRARAATRLCRDAFPPKRLDPIEKGLKRIGRALGTVRDLDVALENLSEVMQNQPKGHVKALKRLRANLTRHRLQAHVKLTKVLNSKKHRNFIKSLARFCMTPATELQTEKDRPYAIVPTQLRHTLPSIILHSFEVVRAYEIAFEGKELPPLESFHALRISSKYLRYLLEFTQSLWGKEGGPLLAQLRDLQERLGLLNDAHVEEQRLRQWAENTRGDSELHDAITTRLAETTTRIAELAAAIPPRFDALISPTTRNKLGIALARL